MILSNNNRTRTVRWQIIAQILIFSSLVCLGLLLLWPVQQGISRGMTGIRNDLIGNLETLLGRQIRYSSISPSIFGAFDIRNMRVVGEDSQPVVSISRLRVSYSLWEMLRGKISGAISAIRSVRLDSPRVDLNLERDRDLIDLLRSFNIGQSDSRRNLAASIPERFAIRVNNGQGEIQAGRDRYRIQNLNLEALIADNRIRLDGGLTSAFSLNRLQGEPFNAQIGIQITGAGSTDLGEGSAVITIPGITGNLLEMRSLAFGLDARNGVLRLRKQGNSLPFDFSMDYNVRSGDIIARFNCADFMLRDLFSFSGDWQAGNRWLNIAGTGTASLDRDYERKLSYWVDLAGTIPAGDASFAILAGGDEKLAEIKAFHFSLSPSSEGAGFLQGEVDFRGNVGLEPFAPNGVLSLENVSVTGIEGVSAEFDINTRGAEISVSSDAVSLSRTAKLNALSASFVPSGRNLDFAIFTRSAMRPGSLSLDGSLASGSRQLEANLLLDSFSPADISAMLRPFFREAFLPAALENVLQDTSINTDIFVNTDFEHILYRVPRLELVYAGKRGMTGLLSMSGTDHHFELSEGRFMANSSGDDKDILLVSAQAQFADQQDIQFSLNASYRDYSYHLDGRALDRRNITIEGSHGLLAQMTENNTGVYSGSLKAQEIPIPFRGSPAYLSFLASLRYASRDSWSLAMDSIEMRDIASPAGPAHLRCSGWADQSGAQFPLLYYSDNIGPLNGSANMFWAGDFSGISGTLDMEGNQEQYRIEGAFMEQRLDLSLSGSRMRFDRVTDKLGVIRADGNIRLSQDRSRSFQAEFNLASLSARMLNQEFRASAQGLMDSEEFTVRNMRVNFAGLEGVMPLFRLSLQGEIEGTQASIQGLVGSQQIEGSLALEARFMPLESWLDIGDALNSLDGFVHVENMRYGDNGSSETFNVNFSRNNGALLVLGGPHDMLRMQMDKDGNFYAGLSSPFPVRGSIIGSVNQRIINARCNDLYVDLAEFWKIVPPGIGIALAGGYVNASVDIRGSLSDPEFFGQARASSARIQVPKYITQDIRPIPFTVAIDGNEMHFGPVPATVGNGAGMVSARFQFDRWIPNIFSIDIQVPRETPIPVGFDITSFLTRGDVSGNLNLSMENMVLGVSGDILANNAEMSLNTEENRLGRTQDNDFFSASSISAVINLNVSTGSSVEFYWPNLNWPILRATPVMGTRVEVSVDTQAQRFSINSDINIRSGEIFYFERSFYIRSGSLVFRESEYRFEPRLSVRAEVRDQAAHGPVTISMIVENAPLFSFSPRFESSPFLSQMEIFTILGQTIYGVPDSENSGNWQQMVMSGADMLTQFFAVRWIEQQIRSFMRLDMFSIRSQFLQNALLSTFNTTGLGQTLVDRPGVVGNYLDNTTVFFGKYVGQDMFIQSLLSMKYDAEQTNWGNMRLEPDFGIELQNPLFSIRWDFNPTHPENWYLNDNSITLSKSWTF